MEPRFGKVAHGTPTAEVDLVRYMCEAISKVTYENSIEEREINVYRVSIPCWLPNDGSQSRRSRRRQALGNPAVRKAQLREKHRSINQTHCLSESAPHCRSTTEGRDRSGWCSHHRHPVTGKRGEIVIDANPGLREADASGAVNLDHFVV